MIYSTSMIHYLIKFDFFYEKYNCLNFMCGEWKREGLNVPPQFSLNTDITNMEDSFFKKVIADNFNCEFVKRLDEKTGEVSLCNAKDWEKLYK